MRYDIVVLAMAALVGLPALAEAQDVRLPGVLVKLIEEAEVPALEKGVLASLAVQEGDKVGAGALLGQIDDRDARLLVARHESELAIARREAEGRAKILSAEASLKVAQSELKRAQDARSRLGASVSDAELDRLMLAVTQAQLSLQQAEHEVQVATLEVALRQRELDIAQRAVERHSILAPFDGVVAQVYRRRGEWVEPGEKVMRLVRTDRLKVEGFVPLDRVASLAVGNPVDLKIETGASEQTYRGRLTVISPEADPFNGQVRVVAEIENPSGMLRPGQKGTLSIRAK